MDGMVNGITKFFTNPTLSSGRIYFSRYSIVLLIRCGRPQGNQWLERVHILRSHHRGFFGVQPKQHPEPTSLTKKKTSKVNLKSVGHKISEALTPWKTKKLRALDKMLISWPHLNGGCPTTGYNQHPLLNRHRPHQSSSRFRTKTICYELHYIPDIAFTSALLTRIPAIGIFYPPSLTQNPSTAAFKIPISGPKFYGTPFTAFHIPSRSETGTSRLLR